MELRKLDLNLLLILDALFDDAYHGKHVDTIFRRVFGEA